MHSRNNTGLDYASSSDIIARMTKEIIEIAVKNYSSALQFVKLSKEKLIELGIN
jgi:hypothetical protein